MCIPNGARSAAGVHARLPERPFGSPPRRGRVKEPKRRISPAAIVRRARGEKAAVKVVPSASTLTASAPGLDAVGSFDSTAASPSRAPASRECRSSARRNRSRRSLRKPARGITPDRTFAPETAFRKARVFSARFRPPACGFGFAGLRRAHFASTCRALPTTGNRSRARGNPHGDANSEKVITLAAPPASGLRRSHTIAVCVIRRRRRVQTGAPRALAAGRFRRNSPGSLTTPRLERAGAERPGTGAFVPAPVPGATTLGRVGAIVTPGCVLPGSRICPSITPHGHNHLLFTPNLRPTTFRLPLPAPVPGASGKGRRRRDGGSLRRVRTLRT